MAELKELLGRNSRNSHLPPSLPEIVMATKQPPDVVRQLYCEWSTTLEEGER